MRQLNISINFNNIHEKTLNFHIKHIQKFENDVATLGVNDVGQNAKPQKVHITPSSRLRFTSLLFPMRTAH